MSWQILLATSIVTFSIATLLQKVVVKGQKSDPIATSVLFMLITGLFTGAYTLYKGFHFPSDIKNLLPFLLAEPVIYAVGNIFIFKSLKKVEASKFTILYSSRVIVGILGAILFLGEIFSIKQVIGTILLLGSVALISWKNKRLAFKKEDFFVLVAAVTFGLGFVVDSYIVRSMDVATYFFYGQMAPAILILLIYLKSLSGVKSLVLNKKIFQFLVLGFFYTIQLITYYLAYQAGRNAAQITAINQTAVIVTVFLSVIFLKERSGFLRKIIAAFISFFGVVLVK